MKKPDVVISTRLREIADRLRKGPLTKYQSIGVAVELDDLANTLSARVAAKNSERAAAAALTDTAKERMGVK